MPVDPFRIQILTLTLDSQVVLTLVGMAVAGLVFRLAARRAGFSDFSAATWWDVVTAAIIGARLVWVVLHVEYYLRGPLQVLVVTDGGLHPVGLVLGAAYAVWRLNASHPAANVRLVPDSGGEPIGPSPAPGADARPGESGAWRPIVGIISVGVLVAFLFERAGCALTTCGGGLPADLAWALRRGDELRQPVALYQVAIVAVALLLVTEAPRLARRAFEVGLVALTLVEIVGLTWGGRGPEELVALVLAGGLALAASLRSERTTIRRWAGPLAAGPKAIQTVLERGTRP
ncbi:MAG: prolipoprotein diacylglyceryl transferase [Chloroflexi bacterium]|nr:prolipoprotein diacylglyceryl transferase [Chloroflexota bacterium]